MADANTNPVVESPKVTLCRARLKAAQMRVAAAHHDSSGYHRQASHPLYDGQEAICMQKAGIVDSLKAEKLAEADLIEAEAEAAYKAATGEEAPHA